MTLGRLKLGEINKIINFKTKYFIKQYGKLSPALEVLKNPRHPTNLIQCFHFSVEMFLTLTFSCQIRAHIC